jgi:uncharacterized protein YwqG
LLLLQIDQPGKAEPFEIWGNNGLGYFFIHPNDLKKRDFSKVKFYWDSY